MRATWGWLRAGAAVAAALALPAAAPAHPLILPSSVQMRAGQHAWLELAAPEHARACSLTFRGGGDAVGPYNVSLGGPTRYVHWTIPRGAGGVWTARFSCRTSGPRHRSLGSASSSFLVGAPGRATGRVVDPGSLRIGPGSIPELKDAGPAAAAADASGNREVDTTIGNGDPTKFTLCGRFWIYSTRTIGDGVGTYLQLVPTQAARKSLPSGRDTDPIYPAIWDDVRACTHLAGLSGSQMHSMYMQLACHVRYGLTSWIGGNTWDLEAWRKDVDWSTGLSLAGSCGQAYGDVEPSVAGRYLRGRIVNQFPDPHPEQRSAWLVDSLNGKVDVRLHITTTRAYGCLLAAGKGKASWFPAHFLDEYIPVVSREIGDEVCGASPTPGGGAGPPGGGVSPGGARVTLAQGPAAPAGYRYAIALAAFPPNRSVSITCHDSVSPGGFYTFTLATDGAGNASTAAFCFSGDGPDHWVVADGVQSNHVPWGGAAPPAPPPPPPPPPPTTYGETTGGVTHTWTNYTNAGGFEGPTIPSNTTVQIACKLTGFRVADGNTWWYRIASAPWNGAYYASADAFYNNGQTSGSLRGTPFVDPAVRDC